MSTLSILFQIIAFFVYRYLRPTQSSANRIQYNNPSWFSDGGARGYFQLYDWTVCGLHNALDAADAMGKVATQT